MIAAASAPHAVCPATASAMWERRALGATVLLGLALLAASEPGSVNDTTNLRTIESLFHRGTFELAPPGNDPVANRRYWDDVIKVDDAYYSVRPPVLAFLSLVPYALLDWSAATVGSYDTIFRALVGLVSLMAFGAWVAAARRRGTRDRWALTAAVLALLVGVVVVVAAPLPDEVYPLLVTTTSGVLTAVAVMVLVREAQVAGAGPQGPLVVAAGVGLFSMVTVYTTVVNHHTTAGALLTVAVCELLRWRREGRLGGAAAFGIGLALGLAPTIDVAGGGIFLLCLGPIAVWRSNGVFAALGIALAAALHAILNIQITGDVVPGLVQPEFFDFPESRQTADRLSGLWKWDTAGERLVYAARVLGGGRGLLLYTPLVVPAMVAAWRLGRRTPYRRELALILVATVAHVIYTVEFTNNLSGTCYGVRWFVLAVPLWWLLLILGWPTLGRAERAVTIGLGVYSAYVAWWGVQHGAWEPYPLPISSVVSQRIFALGMAGVGGAMLVETWRRQRLKPAMGGADSSPERTFGNDRSRA